MFVVEGQAASDDDYQTWQSRFRNPARSTCNLKLLDLTMMYDEQQPLLDPESYDNSKPTSRRERIAIHLESPVFHKTVLTLVR
jgi:hypothetical protein